MRYLIERMVITVAGRSLTRVFLIPANDAIRVLRIDLHEPCHAPATLAANERRAGPSEQVCDDIAGLAAVHQRALDQFHRLGRWVDAIRCRLVFMPQRRLRFVPVPSVFLTSNVRIEEWFVLEFVPPKAHAKVFFAQII